MDDLPDARPRPVRTAEGLADRVYRELLAQIIDGNLREGDRLSTEQALAEQFNTSRPTVREALSRLRADGIVTSRQGAGTFVVRRPDPDVTRFMPLESMSDVRRVLEFRIVVESGAAALAATVASDADLQRIRAALQRLEAAVQARALGVDEDFEFHLAVAQATHNQFFVSVIASIQPHMEFGMNLLRNFSLHRTGERVARVQSEHGDIVEAIAARDADAAGRTMRLHLENTRQRMFGS
jgi:GntR family transcriptional regulator, transcriptional repressor for pyruvate dehydrogenase complex